MKQRTWVKKAAVVFFAMMLLLTFFSGTIRNWTLPQVTTKPVTAGAITPVVSGAGLTEAGAMTELTAQHKGAVLARFAAPGEAVKAGNVILKLEYRDDGSLAAKQAELEQQEKAYAEAVLNASLTSDASAWTEYQIMRNNLEDAKQRQARCEEYTEKRNALNEQLSAANDSLLQAQDAYHAAVDAAAAEADTAREDLLAAQRKQENAQANYNYQASVNPESEACADARAALDAANAAVLASQNRCYEADTLLQELVSQHKPALDAAQQDAESLNAQISALEMEYVGCTDETACENAVLSAKSALAAYYERQQNAAIQDELTAARLAELETRIGKTRQELVELEAKLGETDVCVASDGIIGSLLESDSFEAGETLACLQSTEAFTLRCSVPLVDAALLTVGDEARITNQSGGGSKAVLTAIEADQTDPANRKTLCFAITGSNAAPGQYLTLTVALKTTKHDLVVPNAALYKDSIGSFVYAVETKTTLLGSRSKVRRVDVELIRQDDSYSAISGELTARDYVVILSSVPLSDGQAVRFGD